MNDIIELDADFIDFYWVLKEFNEKTKKFEFGNGYLPQLYTEKLCRAVFSLIKNENKDFDAKNDNGQKIEIKATITRLGTTTINPHKKFDLLYWLYFDFESDEVLIYKISGKEFRTNDCFPELIKKERSNINLANFMGTSHLEETLIFEK